MYACLLFALSPVLCILFYQIQWKKNPGTLKVGTTENHSLLFFQATQKLNFVYVTYVSVEVLNQLDQGIPN